MAREVTVRFSADISAYLRSLSQAEAATDRLATSVDGLDSASRGMASSSQTAASAADQMGSSAQTAGAGMDAAAAGAESTEAAMSGAGAAAQDAAGSMESAGASAQTAGAGFDSVGAQSQDATAAMLTASGAAQDAAGGMESAGAAGQQAGSGFDALNAAAAASAAGVSESSAALERMSGGISGISIDAQTAAGGMEAMAAAAQNAGGGLESASASAQSAAAGVESAGSSAQTAGAGFESAGSAAQSASGNLESAGASAQSAAAGVESAGSAAQGAGAGFESAGASAQSAAGNLESAGASAQSAAAGVESAGAAASTAGAGFETVGASAQTAGADAESAAGSFESVGASAQTGAAGVDGLSSSMDGVGSSAAQADTDTQGFLTTAQGSAREFTTMGAALGVVGGGMLALSGHLISTGIEYNNLQQVAGQALSTMTDSAEDAMVQMDRLNEFASTSPFFRDTWLEAQRQLMAFGMEAERVVPTLEGVEEAVAAIGGGDQEIRQLVDILGQIEGQGRITGRELQRLGQMGINAAELMGDAMGVSGDEIRTQITAGTLDAGTAIEALTDGMMMNFEGSADSIRDTFQGATNDVIAFVRDIGSIIATPLVNPEGGGFLVDIANMAGDTLLAVRDLPEPLLQIAGLGTAAAGGVGVLAAAFFLAAPRVLDFAEGIGTTMSRLRELGDKYPRFTTGLQGITLAAGAAAVAIGGLMIVDQLVEHFRDAGRESGELERELNRIAIEGGNASDVFAGLEATLTGNLGINRTTVELDDMHEVLKLLNAGDMFSWIPGDWHVPADVRSAREEIEGIDGALSNMVSGGSADQAVEQMSQMAASALEQGVSLDELADRFPDYVASLDEMAVSNGVALTETELLAWAFQGVVPEAIAAAEGIGDAGDAAEEAASNFDSVASDTGRLTEAFGLVAEAAGEASSHLDDVVASLTAVADMNMSAEAAVDSFQSSTNALNDVLADEEATLRDLEAALADGTMSQGEYDAAVREARVSIDGTNDASIAFRDSIRDTTLEIADMGAGMATLGASQDEVSQAMQGGIQDIIGWRMAAGESREEAEAWVRSMLDIPDEVSIETYMDDQAKIIAEETERALEGIPDYKEVGLEVLVDDAMAVMEGFVNGDYEALAQILGDDDQARAAMDAFESGDYQAMADIMGDDTLAWAVMTAFLGSEHNTNVDIDGNPLPAESQLNLLLARDDTLMLGVDADTEPARNTLDALITGDWNLLIDADADTGQADSKVYDFLNQEYLTMALIDGDDARARAVADAFTGADHRTTANIDGNDAPARSVIGGFLGQDHRTTAHFEGNDAPARGVVGRLVSDDHRTTAHFEGNDAPARGVVGRLISDDHRTTAHFEGNDAPARGVMAGFLGARHVTTAHFEGNDGPARGLMHRFTGTNWGTVVTASASTARANAALNYLARRRTAVIDVQQRVSGGARRAGRALGGGAEGGRAGSLPAFSTGGRLPSTGLGTDSILGMSRSGTPTAWVDDKEWIINRHSSDKHDRLLAAINRDDPRLNALPGFASGGRPREFAAPQQAPAVTMPAPPPVDTSGIATEVRSAMQDLRLSVRIGQREFSAAVADANSFGNRMGGR